MLLTPDFYADPNPTYHALRDAGPLHYSEEFFGGAWLLTRYEDVAFALKDERLSARRTGGWLNHTGEDARHTLAPFQQIFARAMLFLDAPDHPRLRQAMMAGFRPGTLQAAVPHIEAKVEKLLDAIDTSQPFDIMAAFARPLPALVIAGLMGVPEESQDDFTRWSDDIAEFIGHPHPGLALGQRAQRSALAMAAFFRRWLPLRRENPGDDLVSLLLRAEAQGQIESGEELVAQCAMLLFAGHETTRNLLGNGLHALLSQPGAWLRLQHEPELLPTALREVLRHDSPVQYTGRRVAAEFSLHGQAFRRGDLIVPLIGAANRDPSVYTEPDGFRMDRRESAHLSFGFGAHVCIGAALTYLEAEIAFRGLLRRWPDLQLAGPAQRAPNAVYRGFASLPVVSPAAQQVRAQG
jgi:cytochrome P450